MVTMDSARWALNKDVAPQITYPVLTPEANLLLQNHLTQREYDLWASLGDSWRGARDFRDNYTTRTLTRGQSGFSTSYRGDKSRTLPH
uniref:EPS8 spectrin-like domain-containing protein n=1 Tax=Romanomermis culicivorax TaxID=13658 RepID=A0A915JBQ3_ROMCU